MPSILRRTVSAKKMLTDLQAQSVISLARLQRIPRRLENLLAGAEKGSIGITLRGESGDDVGGILGRTTAEIASTLVSIAAVVIAVVLVVAGGGPVLGGSITLFGVLGAVIGLFGFLGLLRIVRRTFTRRG
jgi:ubiquinone biosynthesis protein